jgi:hypothetical protein
VVLSALSILCKRVVLSSHMISRTDTIFEQI